MFETLKVSMTEAWTQISAAIQPILPILKVVAEFFGVIIVGAIILFMGVVTKVINIVAQTITGLVEIFSGVIRILRGLFEGLFSWILGDNENATASFKEAWEGVKSFFDGLFRIFFSPFVDSWEEAKKTIMSGVDFLIDKFTSLVNWIKKAIGKQDELNDKRSSGDGGDNGQRATGGSVMAGKRYLVGENGAEYFIPTQSGRIEKSGSGASKIEVNFNNVQVRNDTDLNAIVAAVERTLGRKQELTRLGA